MRIRLHGTEAECATAVALLRQILDVRSVSARYADRGDSVLCRVYVDAALPGQAHVAWMAHQEIVARYQQPDVAAGADPLAIPPNRIGDDS